MSATPQPQQLTALEVATGWLVEPTPSVLSKFSVELFACMMFHFIGSVAPTPWANGIALIVLVYFTAKTSGAHLNPAISLSFMMLGYTNPLEMLAYWAAQVAGCMLGALWIAMLVPDLVVGGAIVRSGPGPFYDGCFVPTAGMSARNVFGWEAVCTFNFVVTIFSVVWYTYRKEGYGNSGPLLIGLSLLVNAMVAAPFTGAALNPARVLGSYAVFRCGTSASVGYYVAGEMLAGFLVPFVTIPWYGICPNSWYLRLVPKSVARRMKNTQPSIVLTLDAAAAANAAANADATAVKTEYGMDDIDRVEGGDTMA